MTTLFIDADACPVTGEALAVARRAGVPVVIAGNTTQNLERHVRAGDPRDAAHAKRSWPSVRTAAPRPIALCASSAPRRGGGAFSRAARTRSSISEPKSKGNAFRRV